MSILRKHGQIVEEKGKGTTIVSYLMLNILDFSSVEDGLEVNHDLQMLPRDTELQDYTHASQLSSVLFFAKRNHITLFSTAHFRYFNSFSLLLLVLVVNRFRMRVCVSVCFERAWVCRGAYSPTIQPALVQTFATCHILCPSPLHTRLS